MRYITPVAAMGLLVLTGCPEGGLSTREAAGEGSGVYLAAMTSSAPPLEQPSGMEAERMSELAAPVLAGPVKFPMKLGVAQIGEVAPPETMLTKLRESKRFAAVGAIPAVGDRGRGSVYRFSGRHSSGQPTSAVSAAKSHLESMRSMAALQGLDYLLVVGGTTDSMTENNPLSVMNLTIVGMFVVPGKETTALMKASGALMEVKSGALVSISVAEEKGSRLSSVASQDGDRMKLFKGLRDKVTVKLAEAVVKDLEAKANLKAAEMQ